jgi:metal-responsive CopG/Arc/MetJ family transcriptional regulator
MRWRRHLDATLWFVRTTVTFDDDVAAALDRLRRERSIGLSEAVNELVRAGLRMRRDARPFRQRTKRLGLRIDVTDVAEALEQLEGPAAR